MGDLVDAALPRTDRVTLANREQHERGLRDVPVDVEYSSPLAIRLRDVVLHASAEARAVARFSLARAERLDGDAPCLQLANDRLDRRSCRLAGVLEVLGKSLLVYPQVKAQAPRPAGDRLSLAVGRLHQRPVLAPEFLGLPRRHRPGPRPPTDLLDRRCLRGPIRGEDQLHLRRFLLGHLVDLRMQVCLGHRFIVAPEPAEFPATTLERGSSDGDKNAWPAEASTPGRSSNALAWCSLTHSPAENDRRRVWPGVLAHCPNSEYVMPWRDSQPDGGPTRLEWPSIQLAFERRAGLIGREGEPGQAACGPKPWPLAQAGVRWWTRIPGGSCLVPESEDRFPRTRFMTCVTGVGRSDFVFS
jgi:hypothetical protein